MKNSTHLFLLLMLSAPAATAVAADSAAGGGEVPVDTSNWKCKYCAFEEGLSATLDLGPGYVSNGSYKFGEYNGLYKQGSFLDAGGSARYRGEDANYWNIDATNLGLDTRSLNAEGGKQGTYKLLLNYREIPHFISNSAQTPFLGAGGSSLTLPSGWVPAGTTGTMTALPGSLRQANLETERKRVGVGVSLIGSPAWVYAVNFKHETKEGTQRIAGTFSTTTAAELVMPVDYVTDQLDASASYTGGKLQAKFGYYQSTFSNNNSSLTWQNPYTPLFGNTAGQLALPPDNQFQQVLASAGYQLGERTRATADIALGRMTQNQNYLAPTLNTSLAVPALPRNSLDGRVDTTNANLKLVSALTNKLRLNAAYTYNDHNDKTPQSAYTWVSLDSSVNAATRTNLPYSFTQNTLKLSADYQLAKRTKTSAGFDYDEHKRTYQEVEKTHENTVWARIITRNLSNVDVSLRVAHAVRNTSGYGVVPEIQPPENPLMRKYNMADRTRDTAGFRADVAAGQRVNFGFQFNYSNDDYSNSSIGLTSAEDLSLGGDVSVIFTKKTSLHFYLNHEEITSQQAGSSTYSTPDWTAQNDDTVDVAGIGMKHTLVPKKLDVGADYTTSRSRGQITVNTAAPTAAFPDLTTWLDSLKLYATYRLKDNLSLHGAYWYETYNTQNWSIDGVRPNTIPSLLAFGEQPPSYHVNVITLALRYNFK